MDSPLRAVLASFSVLVDDAPLTKLDRRIAKLKDNLWSAGKTGALALAGIGFGAYKLLDAASHADEALNVLTKTFGSSSDGVLRWSKTIGKEMSRSEYMLQDTVGKFGAFLDPIFKDSGKDITEMSKKLTELSVDLASFYNTSDEEAAMRLSSGMQGETESVRRLGVDISDAALKDLNRKNGDTRSYATLSLAEKTALRFDKILLDTEKKQGDAKKTADQWANSSRALTGSLHKLSVEMGRVMIPTATKLLRSITPYVEWFGRATDGVDILQVALVGLGTKWAITGAQIVWTNRAVLISMANVGTAFKNFVVPGATVLALAAIGVAFEDIYTFTQGGRSVFGSFYADLMEVEEPLDYFNGRLKVMNDAFANAVARTAEFLRNLQHLAKYTSVNGVIDNLLNPNEKGFGWDPTLAKTDEQDEADRREKARIAVNTDNPEMYREALSGSGLGDKAILQRFNAERAAGIGAGLIIPTPADVASGSLPPGMLSSPAPSALVNGGQGMGPMSGSGGVVLNQTVVGTPGMSVDELATKAAEKTVELMTRHVLADGAEELMSSP